MFAVNNDDEQKTKQRYTASYIELQIKNLTQCCTNLIFCVLLFETGFHFVLQQNKYFICAARVFNLLTGINFKWNDCVVIF